MKALLCHPLFPTTYWGFQHALPLAGRRATLPPLGLITLAALLPESWELRLVDLNVEPLRRSDLDWADVVLAGGMRVQAASLHDIVSRARAAGCRTVVGGPAPTTAPEEYDDADVVFVGEAEGRIESLVGAIGGRGPRRLADAETARPALSEVPIPRYDLLDLDAYTSMSVQYSRGCPYQCEFCDIIEIFGRIPRVKTPDQVEAELDAIYRLGFRGSVFVVDDNFIGNRRQVKQLLPRIVRWQRERGRPFELYTEASVNLAADPELVSDMVEAGFSSVFLGIETPSPEALRQARKKQNLRLDLEDAVDRLTRAGLEVMGGFIVGFDSDDVGAIGALRDFVAGSPIPLAMVGLLNALPGTALWRRLTREGRLRASSNGDQFGRPNFQPAMDEVELLSGYAEALGDLYSADAYYARCLAFVNRAPARPGQRSIRLRDLLTFVRTSFRVGVKSPRRRHYWSLLLRALRRAPHHAPWAVEKAIQGEHMIRYTQDDVLPRLARAVREVIAEGPPIERESVQTPTWAPSAPAPTYAGAAPG